MNHHETKERQTTPVTDKTSFWHRLFFNSAVLSVLYRFSCFVYRKARESLIGGFFTTYDTPEEAHTPHSFFGSLLHRSPTASPPKEKSIRTWRFHIAAQVDNSVLIRGVRTHFSRLALHPIYTVGLLLLLFSLSSLIVQVLSFFVVQTSINWIQAAFLILFLFISFLLLGGRKSIGNYLMESRVGHFLLIDVCGLEERSFHPNVPVRKAYNWIFIFCGIFFGLLTYWVPPLLLAAIPFAVLALYLVLCMPEVGVIAVLFAAPFLPTLLLVCMVGYTFISYLFKLMVGRRVLQFQTIDIFICLFAGLYAIGCITSIDVSRSLLPTLVFLCFILSFFLVVNLIRDEKWFRRALFALLGAAVIEAAYGVFQNYFGQLATTWQDTKMFEDISGRVVSTLENPNVLAEYLIMCMPVMFALFWMGKGVRGKVYAAIPFLICAACVIFTWSRGAWLGLILAMFLLLLMLSRKSLVFYLVGIFASPFAIMVMPENILHRFTSIGNLADSSTSYRVNIWRGTLRMLKDCFFTGIGSGIDLFPLVYPEYALNGVSTAPHSHNLYLQIAVEMGVFGLLLFLAIVFLAAKICFHTLNKHKMDQMRWIVAGLACGLVAVLVQGLTDYIWYNYRVFLVFWLLLGLLAAAGRLSEQRAKQLELHI
mgnify:FL=1